MGLHHLHVEDQPHQLLDLLGKSGVFGEILPDVDLLPVLVAIIAHLHYPVSSGLHLPLRLDVVLPNRIFAL